jgi:hypothetical protein
MRKMREEGQEGPPLSDGEKDVQGVVPERFWARRAGSTADTAKLYEDAAFFFIPLEAEDGPTAGPWERGISTQELQSPRVWSLLLIPGVSRGWPTGRLESSTQRPFWALSNAKYPLVRTHRTRSLPGRAVTTRHTASTATVHLA